MKRITSAANPAYELLKKQVRDSRARRQAGAAILDGAHLLEAALAAGIQPELVAASEDRLDRPEVAALLARLPDRAVLAMPEMLLKGLSTVDTPTGLVARIAVPSPAPTPGAAILLEDIQDPGNLGTLLRTAAAAGVGSAYLSTGCADAWSPKVLRAGMGAHFALAIHERADLAAVAQSWPGDVIATDLAGSQSLYEAELPADCAFLFGNEGAGLSPALLAAADRRVRIPMPGRTESLNVGAAAAVCLFEWVRQQQA